ncbi:MAG: LysE family translocator [Pseudomonadota bacterium]
MDLTLFFALMGFALVAAMTPGPNNTMLMASGANFGFARTVPHMVGIGFGMTVMILLVGVGLMELFDLFPVSYTILLVASLGYMIWLAWKIATASAPEAQGETGEPITLLQAALFQWVNPKAWAAALAAITAHAPDRTFGAVLIVAGAFAISSIPAVTSWTWIGREIRRFLSTPARLRGFNWTMAALLILSMVPLLDL